MLLEKQLTNTIVLLQGHQAEHSTEGATVAIYLYRALLLTCLSNSVERLKIWRKILLAKTSSPLFT